METHLFINSKATYDSINMDKLYMAMEDLEITNKSIRLVKITMSGIVKLG